MKLKAKIVVIEPGRVKLRAHRGGEHIYMYMPDECAAWFRVGAWVNISVKSCRDPMKRGLKKT